MSKLCSEPGCFKEIDEEDIVRTASGKPHPVSTKCESCTSDEERRSLKNYRKERTDALSEMFDNVDSDGIYPTTKFYKRIDRYFVRAIEEAEARGRGEAVDYIKYQIGITEDDSLYEEYVVPLNILESARSKQV